MKYQQGFALVTSLLISLVLFALSAAFLYQVRENLTIVQDYRAKKSAKWMATNTAHEVNFKLLTQERLISRLVEPTNTAIEENTSSSAWNFYGEPFEYGDSSQIQLQDASALASLVPLKLDRLAAVLKSVEVDEQRIRVITDSARDWEDADNFRHLAGMEANGYASLGKPGYPRNFYFQSKQELKLVNGMDENIYQRISNHLLYYGIYYTNPMNSPSDLIRVEYGNLLGQRLLELRNQMALTPQLFQQLTGVYPTETLEFTYPAMFLVSIKQSIGDAQSSLKYVIFLRKRVSKPFTILSWQV